VRWLDGTSSSSGLLGRNTGSAGAASDSADPFTGSSRGNVNPACACKPEYSTLLNEAENCG
jgi:hypothetical protein